jgi:hypothetical protein
MGAKRPELGGSDRRSIDRSLNPSQHAKGSEGRCSVDANSFMPFDLSLARSVGPLGACRSQLPPPISPVGANQALPLPKTALIDKRLCILVIQHPAIDMNL